MIRLQERPLSLSFPPEISLSQVSFLLSKAPRPRDWQPTASQHVRSVRWPSCGSRFCRTPANHQRRAVTSIGVCPGFVCRHSGEPARPPLHGNFGFPGITNRIPNSEHGSSSNHLVCSRGQQRRIMVYLIIVLAVLERFVPHVMNFSPVYGALLFGGTHLNKRDSIWFPAAVLGLSDVILTKLVYHMGVGWTELVQLAAFAVIALIGWSLRGRFTIARLTFACFAGSTTFYLVSNFGVWLG